MKRPLRRRLIVTLALAAGMVLGSASVAMAHPNDPASDPSPFNLDNAVFKSGLVNAKGPIVVDDYFDADGNLLEDVAANLGIAQGYFVHSPTCGLHPGLSH